jgi:hypothetical protein
MCGNNTAGLWSDNTITQVLDGTRTWDSWTDFKATLYHVFLPTNQHYIQIRNLKNLKMDGHSPALKFFQKFDMISIQTGLNNLTLIKILFDNLPANLDTDLQQINVLPDDCPHILLDLDDKPEEPPPTKHPTTNIPKQDHTPSLSVCNNTPSNPCRHHHTPPPQPQEPRYNKSLLSRLARIHDCLKKKVRQLISAYCVANFDTGVPTASPLEGRWRRVV